MIVSRVITKVFVAIDDHAELGAPVTQVIVADDLVTQELKCAAKSISDHRGTDVPHVHGFGYIGRGVVDHVRLRLIRFLDFQSLIGFERIQLVDDPLVAQA